VITVGSASKELLAGYPLVRPDGGWSLLIDTDPLGLTPAQASQRLFDHGRVAAAPIDGWGPSGNHYLRLVFANEPVERLGDLRTRFNAAI
jgi:aspartate/methionine/tyrosine aminotransferase